MSVEQQRSANHEHEGSVLGCALGAHRGHPPHRHGEITTDALYASAERLSLGDQSAWRGDGAATAVARLRHPGARMKRGCVAVAVGWYLLVPSPEGGTLGDFPRAGWGKAVDAPLSQWQQAAAFDTGTECQAALERLWKQAHEALQRSESNRTLRNQQMVAYTQYAFARCVASDDPRLRP